MPITLNGTNGIIGGIGSATAQNSTSGTSIDFTGIPDGVKRVTVMLNGVSPSGTANICLQVGAGSVQTSGYISNGSRIQGSACTTLGAVTTYFIIASINSAPDAQYGVVTLVKVGTANDWVLAGNVYSSNYLAVQSSAGQVALSGTLDRVRITTSNGTDTFDAGSINILYE